MQQCPSILLLLQLVLWSVNVLKWGEWKKGTIELLDLACIFGGLFSEGTASLGRGERRQRRGRRGYLLAVVETLQPLALVSPVAGGLGPFLLALVEAGEVETVWDERAERVLEGDRPACVVVEEDHRRHDESSWMLI